jgi:23S rRNA (adenine-N6)-dimethyltransferase
MNHQQGTYQAKNNPHALGFTQNFLHSTKLVNELVLQIQIPPGSSVLEIGPGKGIITRALAERVGPNGRIIAVELDASLANDLGSRFQHVPQVTIVQEDILKFDLNRVGQNYYVVANVPFAITSKILDHLFSAKSHISTAHLILQKDTLVDTHHERKPLQTLKSLLISPWYEIDLRHKFARSDFIPHPSVDTALFTFTKRSNPLIHAAHAHLYQDFLAYVSRDRLGEGAWLKLWTKKQLASLAHEHQLQMGRGLKSQSGDRLIQLFVMEIIPSPLRIQRITGAMKKLRAEQDRQAVLSEAGGHHSSRTRRR